MIVKVLTETGRVELQAEQGQSVLDVLRGGAVLPVYSPCGGQGICGKCTVYLEEADGERAVLACRTAAEDGMNIRLPAAHPLSVAEEGADCGSQWRRDPGLAGYGVACDVGTTTVVCCLLELSTGEKLAVRGEGNDQRSYGDDVVSRIKASMEGHGPAMTGAIVRQLGRMVKELCRGAGVALSDVRRMTVAANPTMCHLLTGLSPSSIGVAPFTPQSRFGDCYDAGRLGLPFDGEVYIAPSVSGYIGGDITADVLATGMDRMERPVLLLDVGTNGEMVLGCGSRFTCCAAAAGPAFEGAQIYCGMTAAEGAISAVEYRDGRVACSVIGGGEPVGLCGSGLVDALAVMLDLGAVDETGRMMNAEEDEVPPAVRPYLCQLDNSPAFRLAGDVVVTQADIRKVQLGKGAIAAGIRLLLQMHPSRYAEIGAVLLAGGFGSCIRPVSAARIGLIPAELLPVTRAVGNAAVQGAQEALLSSENRVRLEQIRNSMEYKELSGLPEFSAAFMEEMLFPEA